MTSAAGEGWWTYCTRIPFLISLLDCGHNCAGCTALIILHVCFLFLPPSYEEAGVPVTDLLVSGASVPSPLSLTSGGMELVIRRQGGAASGGAPRSAVIGCREWARYYRQKPRPSEESHGRALATVIAR